MPIFPDERLLAKAPPRTVNAYVRTFIGFNRSGTAPVNGDKLPQSPERAVPPDRVVTVTNLAAS